MRFSNYFDNVMAKFIVLTGLYTKWDSFTPRKYKINLIRSLTYRYNRLCSSGSLLQSALHDLRKLLLQNGYPQGIINYHINDVLNKNRHQQSNPVSTVPKKDIIILLPYLGLQSNQVAKRLKSCVYKFYSCVNLKIVFQSTRCIKSFFPFKDRINRSQQSRVIYRANCWDCNGFYIGKTKRRLHDRKTEHFKALAKNDNTSAIADHVKATGHNIKWDHFDILVEFFPYMDVSRLNRKLSDILAKKNPEEPTFYPVSSGLKFTKKSFV